jgi:hypothetical protein
MEQPIVDKEILLERFPGKGGWTYALVPAVKQKEKNQFGWLRVKGFVDNYEIKKYHLMPMGNGKLFLPVNATVRKAIKKQEGDKVKVVLFIDNDPVEVPEELMACLLDEADALKFFNDLSVTEQQNYIDWIYSAKREETRIDRMAKTVEKLMNGLRFYDKR